MLVIRIMRNTRKAALLAFVSTVATALMLGDASALFTNVVPCRPGNAKLIAADTQAVVYLGSVRERYNRGISFEAYLGCIRGRRYAYEVGGPGAGSSSGGGGTRNLTVVGPMVAWEEWISIGMGEDKRLEWIVLVRDLRTGRILHKLPTGTTTVKERLGVGPATQIVVSADGAVAWIAHVVVQEAQHGSYQLYVADKTGTRLLASGTNIAPNSLALAGHTLYWTQGGVAMSAPLS